MKPSEKLILRLKNELELEIPDGTIIKSLRTGKIQKSAGAWSWCLYNTNHGWITNYGSQYTVSELLKQKALSWATNVTLNQTEIFPQ